MKTIILIFIFGVTVTVVLLDKPVSFYETCQPSNGDIQTKRWC